MMSIRYFRHHHQHNHHHHYCCCAIISLPYLLTTGGPVGDPSGSVLLTLATPAFIIVKETMQISQTSVVILINYIACSLGIHVISRE